MADECDGERRCPFCVVAVGCPRRRRTGFSPTFEPCQVRTAGGKWAHALCLTLAHDRPIPPRGTGDPLPLCRPAKFEWMAKRRRVDQIGITEVYSEIAILAASRARSRDDLAANCGGISRQVQHLRRYGRHRRPVLAPGLPSARASVLRPVHGARRVAAGLLPAVSDARPRRQPGGACAILQTACAAKADGKRGVTPCRWSGFQQLELRAAAGRRRPAACSLGPRTTAGTCGCTAAARGRSGGVRGGA